jgi:hypothetical protein
VLQEPLVFLLTLELGPELSQVLCLCLCLYLLALLLLLLLILLLRL